MGEGDQGPVAAPDSEVPPYPKAGRWSKHLRDRTKHPSNRQCITPAGVFASASQAGQAHGITAGHAARLARDQKLGWRYFIHGVDPIAEVRELPRGSVKRPVRSDAKAVITPVGRFPSATAAAEHYGISRQAGSIRAQRRIKGWAYADRSGLGKETLIGHDGPAPTPSRQPRNDMT